MIKCESCGEILLPTMRGSLKLNLCPYCANPIMNKLKIEQYHNLIELLSQTTFTDNPTLDIKIRDSVLSLIIANFVFKKLDGVVIAPVQVLKQVEPSPLSIEEQQPVDEEEVEVEDDELKLPENIQKVSSTGKKLNQIDETAVLASTARKPAAKSKKLDENMKIKGKFSAKDYMTAQNEPTYNDDDSTQNEIMGLTPTEIMKAFPGMSKEEAMMAIQEATGASNIANQIASSAPQKGLTGNGIKRL